MEDQPREPSNVLEFKPKPVMPDDYRACLVEIGQAFDGFIDQLRDFAVGLLIRAEWRAWAESQPVGTTLEVSEAAIVESGNPHVQELHELAMAVGEVRATLNHAVQENSNG